MTAPPFRDPPQPDPWRQLQGLGEAGTPHAKQWGDKGHLAVTARGKHREEATAACTQTQQQAPPTEEPSLRWTGSTSAQASRLRRAPRKQRLGKAPPYPQEDMPQDHGEHPLPLREGEFLAPLDWLQSSREPQL